MIGERIGNHRIISKIGQGGMGTVYEGEDTTLGRKVAVKIVNPGVMERGGKELERFQSEARVQASLNHPNIVTLYQFEPFRDSYCMVMEYVRGRTLADIIRSYGPLPPHIAVNISRQVLEGLSAAHRLGIVHRDLKPSNVMVTPDGIAKVMDFGIAKVQGGKGLTESGVLVGTVFYMSPEQVRGEPADARSDIYSFGIILFELLTGRVPFKEDSDFSIMVHHVQTPPPPPTQLLPDIPSALEDIVMRSLSKDPAMRFQGAEEVISALDAFAEQEAASGRSQLYSRRYLADWLVTPANPNPTPPPPERPMPHVAPAPAGKRPLALIALLLAVVAAAAGGAYYLLDGTRSDSSQQNIVQTPPADQSPAAPELATAAPPLPAAAASAPPQPAPRPSAPANAPARAAAPAPSAAAQPDPAPPAVQEIAADGLVVFLDLDRASEPMSLGAAQAQVAQILRDAGHAVISSGLSAADVRAALERRELAAARRSGIGYIIMGTAGGTLEAQQAYGSTYYVGQVSVNLELVRTLDGSVASHGGGNARSRGTANPQAALNTALMTAVSDAARSLLRDFKP